jgi:hypothetical protein
MICHCDVSVVSSSWMVNSPVNFPSKFCIYQVARNSIQRIYCSCLLSCGLNVLCVDKLYRMSSLVTRFGLASLHVMWLHEVYLQTMEY